MASLLGVIFTFVLMQIVTCQRTPTISYISQEQIKGIGSSVEFHCSVQYANDFSVLWLKKSNKTVNSLPLSSGASLIVRDSRFVLRYDPGTSTYVMQIKDIQETDAGTYQCQIIISIENTVTADVELLVLRPPVISDNSTRSLVVSEGQPIQLECYASGYPTPRVSWRRENNIILPSGRSIHHGNVLRIESISAVDRGTYYCVAENRVGRETKRNVNVEVEFAPVITATRPRLGQALQYDMDLECHVEAYPPPAIVWIKDDVRLSNNQHYLISHFATSDEFTDTTLRVITVEKKQFGNYTCQAYNKIGSAETNIELFESIIPVCPPACGVAQYGAGVVPMSSGPVVAFTFIFAVALRNFYSRY